MAKSIKQHQEETNHIIQHYPVIGQICKLWFDNFIIIDDESTPKKYTDKIVNEQPIEQWTCTGGGHGRQVVTRYPNNYGYMSIQGAFGAHIFKIDTDNTIEKMKNEFKVEAARNMIP